MIDTISTWIAAVVEWMDAIPITVWALIVGLVIGGAATQWVKMTFPVGILFPKMPPAMQIMYIRLIAFVLSFVPTFFIWPGENAVWAATAVGFSSPTIYKILSVFIFKRWPELGERLSGTSTGEYK
jgi:hypothetical protein